MLPPHPSSIHTHTGQGLGYAFNSHVLLACFLAVCAVFFSLTQYCHGGEWHELEWALCSFSCLHADCSPPCHIFPLGQSALHLSDFGESLGSSCVPALCPHGSSPVLCLTSMTPCQSSLWFMSTSRTSVGLFSVLFLPKSSSSVPFPCRWLRLMFSPSFPCPLFLGYEGDIFAKLDLSTVRFIK